MQKAKLDNPPPCDLAALAEPYDGVPPPHALQLGDSVCKAPPGKPIPATMGSKPTGGAPQHLDTPDYGRHWVSIRTPAAGISELMTYRKAVNVTNESNDFTYVLIAASKNSTMLTTAGTLEVGWGDFGSSYGYGTAPVVMSGANLQGVVHTEIAIAAGQSRWFHIKHAGSNIWRGYIYHNGNWVELRSVNLGRTTCASCWVFFEMGNYVGANHPILPTCQVMSTQLKQYGTWKDRTPGMFSTVETVTQPTYSATWTTKYINWSAQGGP
ncbi:MAG TPA: hypothetical protein VJ578_01370 [Dehalococcoidia bacterium]|nr:hypothetical protein [Dehalococcoidia bacterium]